MPLEVLEIVSVGAGAVNEDRAGARGDLAWVIDGATDVLEAPLVGEATDAAWFAEQMHQSLSCTAILPGLKLPELPAGLASEIGAAFMKRASRLPRERHEQPSAAAIVVQAGERGLNVLSLGDCVLIAEGGSGLHRIGISEDDAGDRWVAAEIMSRRKRTPHSSVAAARESLWSKLRHARNAMNTDSGYGIFSITPPPAHFVCTETLQLAPGARVLLASDGLTRLVDVFRRYDAESLFAAVAQRGVTSLIDEVRELERADEACECYPRAKVSDDATGVLLRVA